MGGLVLKLFFGGFLVGDVLDLEYQIRLLYFRIISRRYAPGGPDCMSVFVDISLLHLMARYLPREQFMDLDECFS